MDKFQVLRVIGVSSGAPPPGEHLGAGELALPPGFLTDGRESKSQTNIFEHIQQVGPLVIVVRR